MSVDKTYLYHERSRVKLMSYIQMSSTHYAISNVHVKYKTS